MTDRTSRRPADLAQIALGRPATLAAGRLICLDGPAGSGKTTWAAGVAEAVHELTHVPARVVHMDDLFAGWTGLPGVDTQLDGLLGPLSEGRPGGYRRYDWPAGRFAEEVRVDPVPVLMLEGVGCGSSRFEPLVTVLVWVEAPHDVRMERGLERDGDAFAPHWERWAQEESALFARERTRERADVVVDGTGPYPAGSISR